MADFEFDQHFSPRSLASLAGSVLNCPPVPTPNRRLSHLGLKGEQVHAFIVDGIFSSTVESRIDVQRGKFLARCSILTLPRMPACLSCVSPAVGAQVDDSATFFESLSWALGVICTFGLNHEHIRPSRRGSGPRSSLMAGQWLMNKSSCSRPVRAECKARSSPDTFPPAEEASSLS